MCKLTYIFLLAFVMFSFNTNNSEEIEQAATNVLIRTIGENEASKFEFKYAKT